MYEIRVRARFSATHRLKLYSGQMEPLHGHDWKVEVVFRGPNLDKIGVLVDFVIAESALKTAVAGLHHTCLNEAPLLAGANPTAEQVARLVFEQIREQLGADAPLYGVYVEEAPGCTAAYTVS